MISPMSFSQLLRREVTDLYRDPWLLSLASWVPPLLFTVMYWLFSQGIATDLPIGIVDLDKSGMSRSLARHYNAAPSLTVSNDYISIERGTRALRAGEIYALVVLPEGLEEETVRRWAPQATVFVNSQFLLIEKIVSSALRQAHGTFVTRAEVVNNLATKIPVIDVALSSALPIGSQITPLFNMNKNYAQFLVSAILPAIWQILIIASTTLSMALAQRRYGIGLWLGHSPWSSLAVKMGVLTLIFLLHGVFFLTLMYVWLGWPMRGSWPLLFAAQALTAGVSVGVGCLFFLLTRDAARCLSLAAAYVAPAFAFMGVTFPVSDMTLPARIWRSFIPVCHYIEIQFPQVNYGVAASSALPQLGHLSLFVLPLLFAFILADRQSLRRGGQMPGERT